MTYHDRFIYNTGTPIVALHASASSGRQWKALAHELEGRFDVFAPDLSGSMAKSGHAGKGRELIEYIEQFGQAVHLVGHSNGGGIALDTALTRPDLVRSLTLYEPAVFHILADTDESGVSLLREIRFLSGVMTAAAASASPQDGMKPFVDFWNEAGSWDALASHTRAGLAEKLPSVMADFAGADNRSWNLSDLKRLDMPTLVMTGLESPQIAQRSALEIASAIPGSRIALLPELGHMAPVAQPSWVNPRIIEHISSVERPVRNFAWPSRKAA